LMVKLPEMPS